VVRTYHFFRSYHEWREIDYMPARDRFAVAEGDNIGLVCWWICEVEFVIDFVCSLWGKTVKLFKGRAPAGLIWRCLESQRTYLPGISALECFSELFRRLLVPCADARDNRACKLCQDRRVVARSRTLGCLDARRRSRVAGLSLPPDARPMKTRPTLHLYARGGHAFGLRRTNLPVTAWPQLVETWLRTIGIMS
jgi:hypothetical protein